MDTIFLKVLNMSIGACYVIAAVMLARLLLRRAPKIYSYLLWAVVGFRLCCPFSFQSFFSLFSVKPLQSTLSPGSGAANPVFFPDVYGTLEHTALTPQNLPISGGSPAGYTGSLPSLEGTAAVAADTYTIMDIAAFIWIAGILLLLLSGMVSYLLIGRKMASAVRMEDDVWQSDKVRTPFILGVIRPKIYIPFGLTGESLSYVLTHECIHLQRKDHLVKIFAFLVLTLHWFNPLVWLSFRLLNKDMEMSCDEQVLQKLDGQNGHEKKGYSLSLLSFASDGRFYALGPLAFGELAVKSRIKNVLRWEQPKRCMTACALVFCLVVTAACAANPPGEDSQQKLTGNVVAEVWGYRITDDWLSYRAMNLQYMGHENPVDGAMEAILRHLWLESQVVYEAVTAEEIDAYVKKTVSDFDAMSEDEKEGYFESIGYTYEEWKNHYLPQYDARTVIVAEKAAEKNGGEVPAADIESMDPKITDPQAIEKLRRQYPGVVVSFEEIEGSVSAWAKEQGSSDFEICTTVTSLTGKTKQVYLKMTQESVPYYVWLVLEKRDDGTWQAGISEKKSVSQAISDLNRTQLTLVAEGGSKRTAYSFENFCLFPDIGEYNFGMVAIDWTEGKETVTVNLRQGMKHNIIDG
ncbi:MAG: hypothetical protein IJ443_05825, partial [Firmicutes bacterium]|nr:hypothetical protein [Bacillota bacterium]